MLLNLYSYLFDISDCYNAIINFIAIFLFYLSIYFYLLKSIAYIVIYFNFIRVKLRRLRFYLLLWLFDKKFIYNLLTKNYVSGINYYYILDLMFKLILNIRHHCTLIYFNILCFIIYLGHVIDSLVLKILRQGNTFISYWTYLVSYDYLYFWYSKIVYNYNKLQKDILYAYWIYINSLQIFMHDYELFVTIIGICKNI